MAWFASFTPVLYSPRTSAMAAPRPMAPPDQGVPWRKKYQTQVRGRSRIFNAAQYRFYRKDGSVPVPGVDSAHATASSLPSTPAGAWADGDWYITVTYFNGVIESLPKLQPPDGTPAKFLEIASSAEVDLAPGDASEYSISAIAGAKIRAQAIYSLASDRGRGVTPTHWRLSWTGDASGSASIAFGTSQNEEVRLDYEISLSDGQEITLTIKTGYDPGTGFVESAGVQATITADSAGPAAPEVSPSTP